MAGKWNAVFDRLFPGGPPITDQHITDLIKRFLVETGPTDKDRNHVRAHRYEEMSPDRAKFFLSLDKLEAQFAVFERYLHDLYFVLTPGTSYSMRPLTAFNSESTARDLADLITIGSIHQATIEYGIVKRTDDGVPPWYWYHREEFFKAGKMIDPALDV
jgi:hypothetical protein